MPPKPSHSVVVVGGGIAGLAAAHALVTARPELAVTLLEAGPAVGGKLRVGEVAGQPVDLGAEALLARRPEATDLARVVGLGAALVHPAASSAALWSRGKLRLLPPTVMGVPVDIAAAARGGVISRRGAVRASAERYLPALELTEDVGVGRLVSRRLGREVRDRLVEPVLGGVYAGRADEISLFASMPQLSRQLTPGWSLLAAAASVRGEWQPAANGAPPPVFAGIVGGVGRLAIEVSRDVVRRGGRVRCDAAVRGLTRTPTTWRVELGSAANPEALTADAIVLATPAVASARLLRSVSPQASAELGGVEYASVALVSMALQGADGSAALSGSGFLVPPVEGRVIKAATYSSLKWGWHGTDTVLVRCSVGRHRDESELQRTDEELIAAAAADLRDATGLDAPLVDAVVTRWGGALPQYAVGHLDRMARMRSAVADIGGLEICGAALDGVGVPAVIATGTEAATRVLASLDRRRQ